ncbi:MAG: hypothetical protein WC917_00305 [Bacilli bacterium]|jgi:hypothetical protein
MNEDQIREIIELADPDGKVPQNILEDLIQALNSKEYTKSDNKAELKTTEEQLKTELETEQDWRKRASIAAKIISLGLE